LREYADASRAVKRGAVEDAAERLHFMLIDATCPKRKQRKTEFSRSASCRSGWYGVPDHSLPQQNHKSDN
jgi:hypothetical protein